MVPYILQKYYIKRGLHLECILTESKALWNRKLKMKLGEGPREWGVGLFLGTWWLSPFCMFHQTLCWCKTSGPDLRFCDCRTNSSGFSEFSIDGSKVLQISFDAFNCDEFKCDAFNCDAFSCDEFKCDEFNCDAFALKGEINLIRTESSSETEIVEVIRLKIRRIFKRCVLLTLLKKQKYNQ